MEFSVDMIRVEFDFDYVLLWVSIVLGLIAFTFATWDVHYFLRILTTVGWARIFENNVKIDEETCIRGFCTTNDVDFLVRHMNNARFLRELDFARYHFYDRTGLYKAILRANTSALQSASMIRYRRTIPIFTTFKITTKLVYYEDRSVYLEQKFISTGDNFVRAIVYSKQMVAGFDVTKTINKMLNKDPEYKPICPPEFELWIKSMQISSAKLRGKEE